MKFIFFIISPHLYAFYTTNIKSLALNKILPALSDYYQHLAGGWVWISRTVQLPFRWLSPDPTDDKSILVQVRAWCRQASTLTKFPSWRNTVSQDYNELIAFFSQRSFVFWLKFHLSLFLRIQFTIGGNWLNWWLGDTPLHESVKTQFSGAHYRTRSQEVTSLMS